MWRLSVMVLLVGTFLSCAQSKVRKYSDLIEPRLGKADKREMAKLLGNPVNCKKVTLFERCEYRTARARNDPVPEVLRTPKGMGPDVSPYQYFDVLHLFYDEMGVLKEWSPVVIEE